MSNIAQFPGKARPSYLRPVKTVVARIPLELGDNVPLYRVVRALESEGLCVGNEPGNDRLVIQFRSTTP